MTHSQWLTVSSVTTVTSPQHLKEKLVTSLLSPSRDHSRFVLCKWFPLLGTSLPKQMSIPHTTIQYAFNAGKLTEYVTYWLKVICRSSIVTICRMCILHYVWTRLLYVYESTSIMLMWLSTLSINTLSAETVSRVQMLTSASLNHSNIRKPLTRGWFPHESH